MLEERPPIGGAFPGFFGTVWRSVGRESENPRLGGCAGSLKLTSLSLQFGELQGDMAKLQGQCLHIPAEDPLHLSGLDGFLPNSTSREATTLSREARIKITVPVFFETNPGH